MDDYMCITKLLLYYELNISLQYYTSKLQIDTIYIVNSPTPNL